MVTPSNDEKRAALLNENQAWREAWAASKPGSPQHESFKTK